MKKVEECQALETENIFVSDAKTDDLMIWANVTEWKENNVYSEGMMVKLPYQV